MVSNFGKKFQVAKSLRTCATNPILVVKIGNNESNHGQDQSTIECTELGFIVPPIYTSRTNSMWTVNLNYDPSDNNNDSVSPINVNQNVHESFIENLCENSDSISNDNSIYNNNDNRHDFSSNAWCLHDNPTSRIVTRSLCAWDLSAQCKVCMIATFSRELTPTFFTQEKIDKSWKDAMINEYNAL